MYTKTKLTKIWEIASWMWHLRHNKCHNMTTSVWVDSLEAGVGCSSQVATRDASLSSRSASVSHDSAPNASFLLVHTMGGHRRWCKYKGACHLHELQVELWAPSFSQAPPRLLQAFGEWTTRWKISLYLSLPLPLKYIKNKLEKLKNPSLVWPD